MRSTRRLCSLGQRAGGQLVVAYNAPACLRTTALAAPLHSTLPLLLHGRHFARRSVPVDDEEARSTAGADDEQEDEESVLGDEESEAMDLKYTPLGKPLASGVNGNQNAMNGVGPRHTETTFDGISTQPFPPRVSRKLVAQLDPNLVEIKPDGTVYLPEINYRRILNSAFGPGGWALMPRGPATQSDKYWVREWALFCHGRFVAQASGESEVLTGHMGPATALEGVKSQALVRCCKDIGIASDLWDMAYINEWKSKNAVAVLCENTKTGQKKTLYRRKDRPTFAYPWKEVSILNAAATPSTSSKATPAPDVTEAATRRTASAAASPANASASPSSASAEPFDMDSLLPRELRKYAGKKWSEVASTEEGRNYLDYIANNFEGPAKVLCRRALDTYYASNK